MSSVFISALQTAEGRFPAHRSSSRSTPDAIKSRLFSHRSTPRSSAKAPVSGLVPPPRKATPEVQNSSICSCSTAVGEPLQPASRVPVHNISFNALTRHRTKPRRYHRHMIIREQGWHRFHAHFRRATNYTCWRLGFRQYSVGSAARRGPVRAFSGQPSPEPDLPDFRASGSPVTNPRIFAAGFPVWMSAWHSRQTTSDLRRLFAMITAHAGLPAWPNLPRSASFRM